MPWECGEAAWEEDSSLFVRATLESGLFLSAFIHALQAQFLYFRGFLWDFIPGGRGSVSTELWETRIEDFLTSRLDRIRKADVVIQTVGDFRGLCSVLGFKCVWRHLVESREYSLKCDENISG